jgi:proteasome lid subunit RPN8/RPN11
MYPPFLMEKRLIHRRLRDDLDVNIAWDAIQNAGDTAMRDMAQGEEREHGFQMVGRMVPQESGRVQLKVENLIHVGGATRNQFEVTPELAREINERELPEGQQTVGFAHTHLPHHQSGPSSADLETMQNYPETMLGIVLKVHRDGSGVLSVYDGDGHLDYSIQGNNGSSQSFQADRNGQVDVEALRAA